MSLEFQKLKIYHKILNKLYKIFKSKNSKKNLYLELISSDFFNQPSMIFFASG